jgi:hypothetical protein
MVARLHALEDPSVASSSRVPGNRIRDSSGPARLHRAPRYTGCARGALSLARVYAHGRGSVAIRIHERCSAVVPIRLRVAALRPSPRPREG